MNELKSKKFDIFSWRHFSARSSFYIINWYGYPRGSHEKHLKKIVSFWDTPLNCYMLNVAHVTNDVKWRPIVTTFGTLIQNMSRTELYDCRIFQIFIDNFMRISNFGMGVLHVKVKYWRIFVTSFLCSLKFLLFHRIEYPKRCLWKKIEIFLWLSLCDMTVPSKTMYRPCDLDLWPMKVNISLWIE